MTAAHLSRINYYPVKSLDGQAVQIAKLLPRGAVEHDRRFAIFDAAGQVVDGKRTTAVHRLRSNYDHPRRILTLRLDSAGPDGSPGQSMHFHVDQQRAELQSWLGEYFGLGGPARVEENDSGGFPDDTDASGPTVISVATLEAVANWFPGLTLDEVRARFRPNLEIAGVPAFWEDQLFAGPNEVVEFAIGEARLGGSHPCPRCVVPTRWSQSGQVGPDPAFAKTFSERRKETVVNSTAKPAGESHFDHFFRLAVNTRPVSGVESTIRVGDAVEMDKR